MFVLSPGQISGEETAIEGLWKYIRGVSITWDDTVINWRERFLIVLARLMKRFQYPFSSWLPEAIAAPST